MSFDAIPPPAPVESDMATFLHALFRNAQNGLVELNSLKPRLRQTVIEGADGLDAFTASPTPAPRSWLFDPTQLDSLVGIALNQNTDGRAVYISAGLRREEMKKGAFGCESDVIAVCALKADLDEEGALAAALPKLETAELTPNFIAITAREPHLRAHLWWVLEDPETQLQVVKQTEKALAKWLGGDPSVTDARRIMRLPGSINWPCKPGRKAERVTLEAHRTPAYSFDAIQAAVARQVPPERQRTSTEGVSPASEPGGLPVWLMQAETADHWHDNMHRVVSSLIARGIPADEVESLVTRAMRWENFTEVETRKEVCASIRWALQKEQDKSDQQTDQADAWQNPDRSFLVSHRAPAPPLHLDLFGRWSDWIATAARAASAPTDYVAFALLTIAASLIGYTRNIQPDPKHTPDWTTPPAMWCALVGPPSSGKTPALRPFMDELSDIERKLRADFAPRIAEHERLSAHAEQSLKAWKRAVEKAVAEGEPAPPKPRDATTPADVKSPSVYVTDTTIEKLADILSHSPRGVLQLRDELSAWIRNMTRYSGDSSDRPQWLELYKWRRNQGGPGQAWKPPHMCSGRSGQRAGRHPTRRIVRRVGCAF